MAEQIGCSVDTIRRNMQNEDSEFCKSYKKGFSNAKLKLSEAQRICAIERLNPTMLIWLGKQDLDQRDIDYGNSYSERDKQILIEAAKKMIGNNL